MGGGDVWTVPLSPVHHKKFQVRARMRNVYVAAVYSLLVLRMAMTAVRSVLVTDTVPSSSAVAVTVPQTLYSLRCFSPQHNSTQAQR
jgi:hypothetical protein